LRGHRGWEEKAVVERRRWWKEGKVLDRGDEVHLCIGGQERNWHCLGESGGGGKRRKREEEEEVGREGGGRGRKKRRRKEEANGAIHLLFLPPRSSRVREEFPSSTRGICMGEISLFHTALGSIGTDKSMVAHMRIHIYIRVCIYIYALQ